MVSTQDPSQTRCPGCPRWDREWLPACSLKQMTSEQRGLEGRGCKDTMTLLKIKHYLLPRNHGVHGLGGFKKDPTGWPHKCLENPWMYGVSVTSFCLFFLWLQLTFLPVEEQQSCELCIVCTCHFFHYKAPSSDKHMPLYPCIASIESPLHSKNLISLISSYLFKSP